jgi:hypothetical protein
VVVFGVPPSAVATVATAGDELGVAEAFRAEVRNGGAVGFCCEFVLGLTLLCSAAKGGSGAMVGGIATVVILLGRTVANVDRPRGQEKLPARESPLLSNRRKKDSRAGCAFPEQVSVAQAENGRRFSSCSLDVRAGGGGQKRGRGVGDGF